MRRLVTVLLGLLAIVATAAAVARADDPLTSQQRLDAVASVFAMRPVTIDCKTAQQDPTLEWAWGYTSVFPRWDHAIVDATLCAALAHPDIAPDWQLAVAVNTVVHESGHMRGAWWSDSEARTECFALRHFKYGARMFLIDEIRIVALWPWELAQHFRIGVINRPYASPGCLVAGWPW